MAGSRNSVAIESVLVTRTKPAGLSSRPSMRVRRSSAAPSMRRAAPSAASPAAVSR